MKKGDRLKRKIVRSGSGLFVVSCNSIWSGLCANYVSSARSTLTVGRTWCLSSVSAAEVTFLQFPPQKKLFSSFCCKRNFNVVPILCFCRRSNFSPVSAAKRKFSPVFSARLTFLLCSKTFCCAIKLPGVY